MKKVAISALCIAAASVAMAQETVTSTMVERGDTVLLKEEVRTTTNKYKVVTNTFWNNWFIQAGAGAQISFTEHDRQADFGDRISPALNIAVGKWFTPGIGIRFAYNGLYCNGATQTYGWQETGVHDTGEHLGDKYAWEYGFLNKQKFGYFNLHFDVMFNLCNLIGGYNPQRLYSCIPYAGVGYARVWSRPQANEITANLGLTNAFRVSDAVDINFDIHAMLTNERFSGETGHRSYDAIVGATLGLTYKFKQRGWERPATVVRYMGYDNAALNALRAQLADLSAENARLAEALEACNNKEAQRIVEKIAAGNLVVFKIDSSVLSNQARVNLGFLAEAIKSGDSNAVYTITGFADKYTGNQRWNQTLSENRSKAVYDCLVNEFGVSPDQLRIDSKGGVDNMFYNDPRCSRCVITIANK